MPTDAGIVTRKEVGQWREVFSGLPGRDPEHTPLKLLTTIEQLAEALRGECFCYDYVYATRVIDETRTDFGIRIEVCGWCNRRKELLAAYDGTPFDTLTK